MKLSQLEKDLLLLEEVRQGLGRDAYKRAQDMVLACYARERKWLLQLSVSMLANVVLLMEVFM